MGALSLRLPDELEAQLAREADLENAPRSEVARRALTEWLAERSRRREIEQMAAAARAIYNDPQYREELARLQAESDTDEGWLASIEAQERAHGIDPDEKWWD